MPNSEISVNAFATNPDFEFDAIEIEIAHNYRRAILDLFSPHLRGDVVEVGAGIGQLSEGLKRLPDIRSFAALEPDLRLANEFRQRHPEVELHPYTASEMPAGTAWDGIVSVNVLEHIEDDEAELATYARLLAPRKGAFCILAPADPFLYSPIDRDFGHFRRYTREEMTSKLTRAGFQVEICRPFNLIGWLVWFLNFKILRSRAFRTGKVGFFDRWIFPPAYALERRGTGPKWGQSIVAVARAG
ncbi:MAG: methyltransferase domain-containing protein [Kiritimatiellae bacterium]|jgi:SAM-dependent methyltransferase|nr:methyltransferase domain-containing protein [Kiritimatiellia bacterium]